MASIPDPPKPRRSIADRFWAKVDKSDGPDACYPWIRALRNGYGVFSVTAGQVVDAHRFAWELTHGPIPPHMEVCHRCDNRRCCHAECEIPGCEHLKDSRGCQSHLFLGTYADNMADCRAKDRTNRGERHGQCKLTDSKVQTILTLSAQGMPTPALARVFAVDRATIRAIVQGRTWRHIPRPATP